MLILSEPSTVIIAVCVALQHDTVCEQIENIEWWRRNIDTEVFERVGGSERLLDTPQGSGTGVKKHLDVIAEYQNFDLEVGAEGDAGGEVSERLRQLGYIE